MEGNRDAFVVAGLRSPFARIDRELAEFDALGLSVPVIQQSVVGEAGVGPDRAGAVDLVLWGAVIPNLAVSNWGREAWFDAGLAPSVPCQTVVQACGSSLVAAVHAASRVREGKASLVLCGGVESMTGAQVGLSAGLSRAIRRTAQAGSARRAIRTLAGVRPSDLGISVPAARERTTGMTMGEHAEAMAREWGVEREEQDRFALASHRRAVASRDFYRDLLVTPGTFPVDADAVPRADTSLDRLAGLRPAFDRERGTLTAGNSSPLTDGAAACWVAGREGLERLPAEAPRARLVDWEDAAIDPRRDGLLIAPALAIPRLLARHGLAYERVEVWEVHEAFAAQVLCTVRALESREWVRERAGVEADLGAFPLERVNPHGGSVALGHPFAATGARLLSQTARQLTKRPSGTRAIVSVCAAGGLGNVALLEAV